MKKISILTIILMISTSFMSLSASAAVKPGATCTKLNSTTTTAGYKYTCIKLGKKLVWGKGVKVIVAKATPSPTPSPTPTPTPSPSPTIDQVKAQLALEKLNFKNTMVFRITNSDLERKADSGIYFKSDSRLVTDFDAVRVAAFNLIIGHKPATSHPKISIDYQISKSFPKLLADYSVKLIEETANYWNFAIDVPTSFTVKLVTEKDRESVLKDPLMFSGMGPALDRLAAWDPNYQIIFFTGGGGYLYHQTEGSHKGVLMLATSSLAYPERMIFEWPATASHELTHVIQGFFFKERLPDLTTDQYQAVSPDNFREGTANLFGYALSLGNLGWYSDALDKNLLNCLNDAGAWVHTQSESDIVDLLNATEIRTPEEAHTMSYPTGALLYEWVLYKYGFDKVQELFKGQGSSSDYAANIKNVLGVSKTELYKEAAPYVHANIKRVLAK